MKITLNFEDLFILNTKYEKRIEELEKECYAKGDIASLFLEKLCTHFSEKDILKFIDDQMKDPFFEKDYTEVYEDYKIGIERDGLLEGWL